MIQTVNRAPRPTVLPPGWVIRDHELFGHDARFRRLEVMLSYFDNDANGGNVYITVSGSHFSDGSERLDVSVRSDFCYLGIRWRAETSRSGLDVQDTEMETRLGNLLRMLPGPYGEAWVKVLGPVREHTLAVVLTGEDR